MATRIALSLGTSMICFLALGCGKRDVVSQVAKPSNDVLVQVLEVVYEGQWEVAGKVVVRRDGSFARTYNQFHGGKTVSVTYHGRITESLVSALQHDVTRNEAFQIVDGMTTYEYGIDDHRVQHPVGVGQLLRFVQDNDEQQEAANVRAE